MICVVNLQQDRLVGQFRRMVRLICIGDYSRVFIRDLEHSVYRADASNNSVLG